MKLIALLIAGSCLSQMNFERFFGTDYTMALREMTICSKEIEKVAHERNIDADLVKSIVFPELIRNSVFSGMLEEEALAIGYVEMGSDKIDFSIGKFQIKPSFARQMEEIAAKDKVLCKKYGQLVINRTETKMIRQIRVQRLQNVGWQLQYISCFIDYCIQKFDLSGYSKTEKIKFLSTAYNAGFKDSTADIEKKYTLKAFPYGARFQIKQVSYWEVSLDYYIKYCNSPMHEKI